MENKHAMHINYKQADVSTTTHRNTCSNGHDHESHGELPNLENTPDPSHNSDHGKTDDCDPDNRHDEGTNDTIPLPVL